MLFYTIYASLGVVPLQSVVVSHEEEADMLANVVASLNTPLGLNMHMGPWDVFEF
jgi:hypothetical protein